MFALSASAAIRDAGRDIAEFAVVGFDDIPVGNLVSPALTTVRQPLREMAEAVVRLTEHGAGVGERPSLVFPPTLVVRASTERRIG
jgi:DNA-binding LacI/PurR family transcriptional regulator